MPVHFLTFFVFNVICRLQLLFAVRQTMEQAGGCQRPRCVPVAAHERAPWLSTVSRQGCLMAGGLFGSGVYVCKVLVDLCI